MSFEENFWKKREENRALLKSLGVFNAYHDCKISKSAVSKQASQDALKKISKKSRQSFKAALPSRRSGRLLNMPPPDYSSDDLKDFSEDIATPVVPVEKIKRENSFGAIPGTSVGMTFATRVEASHAGIHRPTVAGIHGNPALGCYSLALSGGYEDDVDLGDSFIYTGEGGRDLKGTKANPKNLRTAPQSKDQVLERGNLALSRNAENGNPVRVLRGYKLNSPYAPEEGYRYDGLYRVVEYFTARGLSGFSVYKFRLERLKDQEPPSWELESADAKNVDKEDRPPQSELEIQEDSSPKSTSPDERKSEEATAIERKERSPLRELEIQKDNSLDSTNPNESTL